MTRTHLLRLRRVAFALLASTAAATFFATVAHHVHDLDFRPLASFCLPILAVFFTFTSLLFIRGRSMAPGKDQRRTLFAAERAMQATVWYLTGVIVGASLVGLLQLFDPEARWALLLFLAPYALMQVGLVLLMRAAWVISPQFLKRTSPYEVWRRIDRMPAHA